MKQRMTKEAFERRIAERAQEIAAIHGPEGMELRIADFDDEQRTYGVAAKFPYPGGEPTPEDWETVSHSPKRMMHGVKIWPWHEHKPKPELYAEAAVRALISWHRRKCAELVASVDQITVGEAANEKV